MCCLKVFERKTQIKKQIKQTNKQNALNPCVIESDWRREDMDVLGRTRLPGGSYGKDSICNAETWVQSLAWEDPLEKEMETHSNILAWRIPWTEERARLQSVGLQRVGHD